MGCICALEQLFFISIYASSFEMSVTFGFPQNRKVIMKLHETVTDDSV